MTPFTIGEIGRIRIALAHGGRMANICAAFGLAHTRDEIVEAIDAIRRFERDADAMKRANLVLSFQESGLPLINGKPAWETTPRVRPAAMF